MTLVNPYFRLRGVEYSFIASSKAISCLVHPGDLERLLTGICNLNGFERATYHSKRLTVESDMHRILIKNFPVGIDIDGNFGLRGGKCVAQKFVNTVTCK